MAVISAWHPPVVGIQEVFHARFAAHAYPAHTHEAWTLLIVDDGVVRYDLDRRAHGAERRAVTLLPPGVPHDGRSVRPTGFRKRVLYLDPPVLGAGLVGAAVDRPSLPDPLLRTRIAQLHDALAARTEDLEAESRLAFVVERLRRHLRPRARGIEPRSGLAHELRDLLDAALPSAVPLTDAARTLGAHPTSLVRAFSTEFGIPPHRYVVGRRLELARRHLLDGVPVAVAADLAGFADQAHLTRHFSRLLGIGPGAYVRSAR
ncbi:AraC family transcriptional regulator [Actinophytocola gossypii]|uniref:AraC family transcriptional regulator n=1 Tax=Actinophytocola gossypii TaxID=2812003 RepID=A0ABT2JHV6_9PSEU|nr:AraC family transcriptional regulator [Actinophytocola gossypii]MCT2587356.1 AraC family transcriptional regulator [Actinophytocola gossypii]